MQKYNIKQKQDNILDEVSGLAFCLILISDKILAPSTEELLRVCSWKCLDYLSFVSTNKNLEFWVNS